MREQYDFSNSVANPYVKKSKKQITIRLDEDVISYFKELSDKNGVPYQNLMNLYLKDCASKHKELKMDWQQPLQIEFIHKNGSQSGAVLRYGVGGFPPPSKCHQLLQAKKTNESIRWPKSQGCYMEI